MRRLICRLSEWVSGRVFGVFHGCFDCTMRRRSEFRKGGREGEVM